MRKIKSRRWEFTTLKSNVAIFTPAALEYIAIHKVSVTSAHANTVDVAIDVGIAPSALPAIVADSTTGGDGIAFSHPGITPGGGGLENGGETPLVTGGLGEPILITMNAAAAGVRVIIGYQLVDTTPPA
jgi:hypothetical protein